MRLRNGRIDPVMAILIALLVVENITRSSGSFADWMYNKITMLPGIIIGLSFHEAAHAYASYYLGDPTPKAQGRLTVNPKSHIDIMGFVFLFIAGFGWGQPVQIDPRYYKHRRRDEMIVALAGVVTNLVIAIVFAFVTKALLHNMSLEFFQGVGGVLIDILTSIVGINIVLMLFNLIPCPPLDGFGVLTQIFNLQKYSWYYTIYRNGSLILMLLIIFGITRIIINPLYAIIWGILF